MITEISKIVALDEKGREFPKTVTLIQENDKNLIEFGLWERYNLDDLKIESPSVKKRFYLDLMGCNHMGSPVYISTMDVYACCQAAREVISQ